MPGHKITNSAKKVPVKKSKNLKLPACRSKSHIKSRASSLIHAISNQLAQVAAKPSDLDQKLKAKYIVMDGLCAYCRKSKACCQDHCKPLVKQRMPTVFCNHFWNMIPCCHTCNSSKRNLSVLVWLDSNVHHDPSRLMKKQSKIIERRKWQSYARLFNSRCQRKHVDTEWWSKTLSDTSLLVYTRH